MHSHITNNINIYFNYLFSAKFNAFEKNVFFQHFENFNNSNVFVLNCSQ